MMRDAPSMTWALVTTMPFASMIRPEPSDWVRRLWPKKRPKKGSTSRTIDSAETLTTAGDDLLGHRDDRGAAGGLRGGRQGEQGEDGEGGKAEVNSLSHTA